MWQRPKEIRISEQRETESTMGNVESTEAYTKPLLLIQVALIVRKYRKTVMKQPDKNDPLWWEHALQEHTRVNPQY